MIFQRSLSNILSVLSHIDAGHSREVISANAYDFLYSCILCNNQGNINQNEYTLPDGKVITEHDIYDHAAEEDILLEAVCNVDANLNYKPAFSMTPDVPVSNDIKSLWALISESSNNCPLDIRKDVCQNIVFYGEGSLVRGIRDFSNRVIKQHFPEVNNPHCVFPPERRCSSWIGGSIWASLSTTQRLFITKKEYDEIGPYAMSKRCYQFGHTRAGDFKSYFEQEVSFSPCIFTLLRCTNCSSFTLSD